MIKLLVFDKDGVILDLISTWMPVVRAVAGYTVERLPPKYAGTVTRARLLAAIGVDDTQDIIDPMGLFASGSFADIRKVWQELLPAGMISLEHDPEYRDRVKALVVDLARGKSVAKGNVKTPLTYLHQAGFKLALLTNDNESSATQNLLDLEIDHLFGPIIGADSGHGGKPEPHGLLHCCAFHGVGAHETLMIGDTNADYGAALNATVADFICIADDPDYRPDMAISAHNVIARLTDLPALLAMREDTFLSSDHLATYLQDLSDEV